MVSMILSLRDLATLSWFHSGCLRTCHTFGEEEEEEEEEEGKGGRVKAIGFIEFGV